MAGMVVSLVADAHIAPAGEFVKVLLIGLAAIAGFGLLAAPVYLFVDRFWKRRDARWRAKHPGQSRAGQADAPPVPYDRAKAPEYMKGVDDDGNPLPEPPRKRKLREL